MELLDKNAEGYELYSKLPATTTSLMTLIDAYLYQNMQTAVKFDQHDEEASVLFTIRCIVHAIDKNVLPTDLQIDADDVVRDLYELLSNVDTNEMTVLELISALHTHENTESPRSWLSALKDSNELLRIYPMLGINNVKDRENMLKSIEHYHVETYLLHPETRESGWSIDFFSIYAMSKKLAADAIKTHPDFDCFIEFDFDEFNESN